MDSSNSYGHSAGVVKLFGMQQFSCAAKHHPERPTKQQGPVR